MRRTIYDSAFRFNKIFQLYDQQSISMLSIKLASSLTQFSNYVASVSHHSKLIQNKIITTTATRFVSQRIAPSPTLITNPILRSRLSFSSTRFQSSRDGMGMVGHGATALSAFSQLAAASSCTMQHHTTHTPHACKCDSNQNTTDWDYTGPGNFPDPFSTSSSSPWFRFHSHFHSRPRLARSFPWWYRLRFDSWLVVSQ